MKFLFALAAGIAGALCCGENLLPNSSFELGTAGWGVMNEVPKENGKFQALRVLSKLAGYQEYLNDRKSITTEVGKKR